MAPQGVSLHSGETNAFSVGTDRGLTRCRASPALSAPTGRSPSPRARQGAFLLRAPARLIPRRREYAHAALQPWCMTNGTEPGPDTGDRIVVLDFAQPARSRPDRLNGFAGP